MKGQSQRQDEIYRYRRHLATSSLQPIPVKKKMASKAYVIAMYTQSTICILIMALLPKHVKVMNLENVSEQSLYTFVLSVPLTGRSK